jgi:hypothetical protein
VPLAGTADTGRSADLKSAAPTTKFNRTPFAIETPESPPAPYQQTSSDEGKYVHHNADAHTHQKRRGVSSFSRIQKVVVQQMCEG